MLEDSKTHMIMMLKDFSLVYVDSCDVMTPLSQGHVEGLLEASFNVWGLGTLDRTYAHG